MQKVKTMLAMVMLVAATQVLNAQDVIFLKSGEEIKAKVIDIGSQEIKYKKWNNPDGPSYSLHKNDIFKVKYISGEQEMFSETPASNNYNNIGNTKANGQSTQKKAVSEDAEEDYKKYNSLYKRNLGSGIASTVIGSAFLVAGIPMVAFGAENIQDYLRHQDMYYGSDDTFNEVMGVVMVSVGATMLATSIPLLITGPIRIAKAQRYKQQAKQAKDEMELSYAPMFSPTLNSTTSSVNYQAGFGISLKF